MVGLSHRIQVRHILVDKPEVAALLKSTIDDVGTSAGRTKMLMRLAEKYSLCPTKKDGGNLGWIELSCNDPRIRDYEPVLENQELEEIIRTAVRNLKIRKGLLYGPAKTQAGHHLILISNEFGGENADAFTGSAV
ncbi:MAG: peptidylprolyl isomerase [Nitrospinaceae bacterium]